MTKFENLKAYVKAQLQKIVNLELEKNQKIADCKYTTISGNKFFVGAEIWAEKKKEIQADYESRIKAIHDEIASTLDSAQKEANQEYASAMPHPTADEYAEVQSMIYRYTHSDKPNKEREFIEQRDFHLENETRLARIYVFAGRDLGISKADAENKLIADRMVRAVNTVTSDITAVADIEQDEYLNKLAPTMETALNHIDMVVDARRFYSIFSVLALQEKAILLTPENFHYDGTYSSWNEVQAAMIGFKNRLFEMGADPGMDLHTFIGVNLH